MLASRAGYVPAGAGPTFPEDPLVFKVEAALGADLTADPATWTWTDITAYVRGKVTITRGRQDAFSVVSESTCRLRLRNDDSRFSTRHPLGAYYPNWRRGTPIRVSLDPGSGLVKRFTGELRTVNPVWPAGNSTVAEVEIIAMGVLHRLGQGQTLDSALRRALLHDTTSGVVPVAYWPMEDASGAASFGSAVGGPAMTFNAWQLASDSSIAGSLPLPQAQAGQNANFFGGVPAYVSPAQQAWAVCWAMRMPAAPSATTGLLAWNSGGTIVRWKLELVPSGGIDTLFLRGYNASGTDIISDTGTPFTIDGVTEPYGRQLWIQVAASQLVAGVISWSYSVGTSDGHASEVSGSTGSPAITLGNVVEVDHSAYPGLTAGGYTIGHVAVATDTSYATFADKAARGFAGEVAVDRFARLCDEEHVQWDNLSSAGTGSPMGSQQTGALLTLLRQCEDAEVGLLYEATDGTLTLMPRADRYNRIPTLALDCEAGHVKLDFAPVDDDQRLTNDETVSRTGGGTARASDVDVRDGTYTGTATVNVQYDWMLPDQASWRLHLSTVDEMRIPALTINLQGRPDLIGPWLATDIGDWLTVDDLPDQYPPGTASEILEGYTEVFDAATWSATLNVSPSRPWEVFELDSDTRGRVDTSGSQLTASAAAGVTTLTVATTSGPAWITTATRPQDFPFDVEISGLRVRVTGIATVAALNDNPYFETDASHWHAQGGTVARSTAQFYQGAASLLLTPDGVSATAEADSDAVPIFAGHTCTASARVFCSVSRTVFITINWFDSAGSYLSTATVATVAVSAFTWTAIAMSATAPAGAGKAGMAIGMSSTPPASNQLWIDAATLTDPLTQTFTVERDVDGVDKTLPSGSAVSLWRPGVLAL